MGILIPFISLFFLLAVATAPLVILDWFRNKKTKKWERTLPTDVELLNQGALKPPRKVHLSFSALVLQLAIIVTFSLTFKQCSEESQRLSRANTETNQVIQHGIHSEGIVVDKQKEAYKTRMVRTGYYHYLTIKFRAQNGQLIQGTRRITSIESGVSASKIKLGDKVDVQYLSEKPKNFILPRLISGTETITDVGSVFLVFLSCIFSIIILTTWAYCWRGVRRAKYWILTEGKRIHQKDDELIYEYTINGKTHQGSYSAQSSENQKSKVILLVNPEDPQEFVIYSPSNIVQIRTPSLKEGALTRKH